ncbi:MAG: DNA polymerase IV [Proteocatella sp.]
MERTILHCDMNNCYASIEMISNPQWRGKAIAVCGSQEDRHGIVLAKSEEAKKFGVKTAETIWQAKQKCPDLIVVPPHYEEYIKYSRLARKIYYEYTNQVEAFGLDECWLDCSGSTKLFGDGASIAHIIKERIKEELGLTISAGVSFNKVFAKLGSDMKKPDAVSVISEVDFKEKLWPLSVSEMIGIGAATTVKLKRYGISTLGNLANANPDFLRQLLGKNGIELWNFANGRDYSRVMDADYKVPLKSVGHGITCARNLLNMEEVSNVFLELSQDVSRRLRDNELEASAIQISVKDSNLFTKQYQCKTPFPTQCSTELTRAAMRLFQEKHVWNNDIRALTICALNLVHEKSPYQYDMFNNHERHEKMERAEKTIYDLRKKYGKKSVTFASLIGDMKISNSRTEVVGKY